MVDKETHVANDPQCPDVLICELDSEVVIVVKNTAFQRASGYEVCSVA